MSTSHTMVEEPKRSVPSGISVLITGAGPVGVFTALECWRKGHSVRIVERNPVPNIHGDFFTISPQVINHIQAWWPQMAEENERIGYDPWVSYHKLDGHKLAGPEAFDWGATTSSTGDSSSSDPSYPLPTRVYRHNRPKFLAMLLSQLQRLGIVVEYGTRVVDYFEREAGAGVTLDDGRKLDADVVVAADGIGTKSHPLVNGHDIRAWSSGLAGFRTAFPVDCISHDKELNERFKLLANGHPVLEMWHGPGMTFSVFRTEDIITWLLMHKDDGTSQETWNQAVEASKVFETLEKSAPSFPEYAKKLIRATPQDGIIDYPLMWRDPQPITTSPIGRVVQVGDAAHSFLPSSGGGANMGIEDAISLASCLELGGSSNISWAAKVHNKLRYERVSCQQLIGFINHQRRSNPDQKAIEKDPKQIKNEMGRWIWSHDPEKYAYENYEKAFDHIKNGTPFQNTNMPRGYVLQPWSVDGMMARIKDGQPLKFEGDWS